MGLRPHQAQDMHLLLAIATFIGAATAMPMVYYPAQYIPADEVLVRMPRQLPGGLQGPLRPVRQSAFAAGQETSRFTIRVCTKPNQTHNHSSILQLLNLYPQTKRLELLSKWFCYKTTPVSVINKHKSLEK